MRGLPGSEGPKCLSSSRELSSAMLMLSDKSCRIRTLFSKTLRASGLSERTLNLIPKPDSVDYQPRLDDPAEELRSQN